MSNASSPIKAEIHSDPSLSSSANSPHSPSPMPNGVSGISDTIEYTVESLPNGTIKSETHTLSPKTERASHDSSTLDQWSAKSEEPAEFKMEPSPEQQPGGVKVKHEGRSDEEEEESNDEKNRAELKQLANMWIDDLIELTIDIPQRVTQGMLALRMCIELARTGQPLTAAQEIMLRDAVRKLEAEAEEWETGEWYVAEQSTIDGSDSD